MKDDVRLLAVHLGHMILFALMVSLPPLLAWLDVHWLHDGIGEWSLVELSQEGFLLASVLAFLRLARRRADDRRFALLVAAFFGCLFLREMDEALDLIAHGFWKYPVAVLAAAGIVQALRDQRATMAGMLRFLVSRPGTIMVVGLVLLVVYSRLMGMSSMWSGLLGDGYVRVLKNAIEEGTELLGYTFILASSVGYVAQRVREPVTAKASNRLDALKQSEAGRHF